jgi:hypothetical protein
MHPMTEKKEQLKDLTKRIRSLKDNRKECKGTNNYEIWRAGWEYRHEHIAYCLVRGRSYDQIEQPSEFNKPNFQRIEILKDKLQKQIDEANAEWQLQHPPLVVANG